MLTIKLNLNGRNVICFGSCSTTDTLSVPSQETSALSNLPNDVLVRILAYTFDDTMYSDEHELEHNDVTLQLLMSTSNKWKTIMQEDEFQFNKLRRRARYLSKHMCTVINQSIQRQQTG